jgi:hypothetical protein
MVPDLVKVGQGCRSASASPGDAGSEGGPGAAAAVAGGRGNQPTAATSFPGPIMHENACAATDQRQHLDLRRL